MLSGLNELLAATVLFVGAHFLLSSQQVRGNLVQRYGERLQRHRLKREIIATILSNAIVNRMGFAYAHRFADDQGVSRAEVVKAYAMAHEVFDGDSYWLPIQALDNQIDAQLQLRLYSRASGLMKHATNWLVNHRWPSKPIAEAVDFFEQPIKEIAGLLPECLPGSYREEWQRAQAAMIAEGVPEDVATTLANTLALGSAPDIVELAAVAGVPVAQATAANAGFENLDFGVGDVYALDTEDDSFDVVHAHQVLQHLSDPVTALREMRRVCRPDGVVAVRDADYAAFTWAPDDGRLTAWLDIYRQVARANGAEPDAGRYLKSWALEAGFTDVTASASVWCFSDAADRQWWGDLWADRVVSSDLARQAIDGGLATRADLESIATAFRAWVEQPDGWFAVLHGEVLARG